MSKVEDLDIKYDVKRHILVVVIVAIVLILVFVFLPLLLDLILGEPTRIITISELIFQYYRNSLYFIIFGIG